MGLGFFPLFLAARKLDFLFRLSQTNKPTAITSIVHCERAPMLLAKVPMFLGTSFLWDYGAIVSTRSLCTLLLAARSFLLVRSIRFLGSFLATCALDSLERQKE